MAKKKAKLRLDRIMVAVLAIILILVIVVVLISKAFQTSDEDKSSDTSSDNSTSDTLEDPDADTAPETDATTDGDTDSTDDADNNADSTDDTNSTDKESEDDKSTVGITDLTVDWNLILVNAWTALPQDFTVETTSLTNGALVDARILDDLNTMVSAARDAGHSVLICSAYRDYDKQVTLFTEAVQELVDQGYSKEDAAIITATSTAIPGTSEHQTGLAVDIVPLDYQMLNDEQANQSEQKWLAENCHKYGFILRYPADKEEQTAKIYEPWHYRYVGVDAATEMHELGLCLEEYYDHLGL